MACPDIFDALRTATEALSDEIYQRAYWQDVWLNLVPRGTFPQNVGTTISVFTIGRNEPSSDEETWVGIDVEGGVPTNTGTAICGTTWNDTVVGETESTYSPEAFGLRGPVICKDTLIFAHKPQDFWEKYMVGLAKRSRRSVSNRLLKLYSQFVPKSVARTDYQRYDQTTLVLPPSICQLTEDMLDQTALELMEDGATDPNTNGWITLGEMGPLFTLYIGIDAIQKILKNNSSFRQDIRDAYRGAQEDAPLMKRLAAMMTIKNFRFLPNLFPPRYTWSAGTYTRVNTWTVASTSKGSRATISTNYKAAPYEAAFVLNPWVFTEEVVQPVNSVAGNSYDPTNYFGEWQWVTGGREIGDDGSCYDPLKKYGRHFAEYKHAAKPIFPEYGRMIIFRRCPATDNPFTCVSCS